MIIIGILRKFWGSLGLRRCLCKILKRWMVFILMEQKALITREELVDLKNEVEGIRATIEILQDKEMMESIRESEEAKKMGVKPWKL